MYSMYIHVYMYARVHVYTCVYLLSSLSINLPYGGFILQEKSFVNFVNLLTI